jgi:hypothetical protein
VDTASEKILVKGVVNWVDFVVAGILGKSCKESESASE